jgi:mRNA interferase MazF
VLVLSHGVFNDNSKTVIAVAITGQRQRAGFPLTLELKSVAMPKPSWIKISQLRTLSVDRLGQMIGRASPEELDQVIEGLTEIIGS